MAYGGLLKNIGLLTVTSGIMQCFLMFIVSENGLIKVYFPATQEALSAVMARFLRHFVTMPKIAIISLTKSRCFEKVK